VTLVKSYDLSVTQCLLLKMGIRLYTLLLECTGLLFRVIVKLFLGWGSAYPLSEAGRQSLRRWALCKGQSNSQGACGQTQEGDGRNLVADWQWEQSRLGVWVVYPSVVQICIFSPVFV
jgi:hypothetical protein